MGSKRSLELDRSPLVAAWVKNDHLGFEIKYSFRGIIRKFRPDYLVRAVNRHGGFGAWGADVSRNPTDIHDTLQRHGSVMDT